MSALLGARETERLLLEPWSDAHTDALTASNADPEVMRYVGAGTPLDAAESSVQSERLAQHWAHFGFGLWAAREKATGATLGFVGLSHPLWLPALEDAVEVGWRLSRAAWGRGLATEAGRESLRAGFEDLRLREIVSIIHPDNAASLAVARKLGLSHREDLDHPRTGELLTVLARRAPT